MKHLKIFETAAAFTAAQATLDLPNVSLIEATMGLNYLPYVAPVVPQHDYVEIGGIKWATMNVGAESVGDYGNYYQYGKGSAQYAETNGQSDYSGTEDPLAASADTATQVWGGNWRTPTEDEFETLIENTENEYMEIDGVIGYKFTDNSDSSKFIFLPLGGYYQNGTLEGFEYYGNYWTSTPDEYEGFGRSLFIDNSEGGNSYINSNAKRAGLNIRPVFDDSNS